MGITLSQRTQESPLNQMSEAGFGQKNESNFNYLPR